MITIFTGSELAKRSNDLIHWLSDRGFAHRYPQGVESGIEITSEELDQISDMSFKDRLEFTAVSAGLRVNGQEGTLLATGLEYKIRGAGTNRTTIFDFFEGPESRTLAWLAPTEAVYGSKEWNQFMTGVRILPENPLKFAMNGSNREARRKRSLAFTWPVIEKFFANELPNYKGLAQPPVGTGPEACYDLTLWLAANEIPFAEGLAILRDLPKESRIMLVRQGGDAQVRFADLVIGMDRSSQR